MTFCVKEVAVDQFIFGVQIVSILLQKHGTIYQVTSIVSNKWKKKKIFRKKATFDLKDAREEGCISEGNIFLILGRFVKNQNKNVT